MTSTPTETSGTPVTDTPNQTPGTGEAGPEEAEKPPPTGGPAAHGVASDDGTPTESNSPGGSDTADSSSGSFLPGLIKNLFTGRNGEDTTRSRLDEIIETNDPNASDLSDLERSLLKNVLTLRQRVVEDIMVPRADIVAVEGSKSVSEVTAAMADCGHSRVPIYRDGLDTVLGMVHIKDLVAAEDATVPVRQYRRDCLFVAPSARILDMLLDMRLKRTHLALVVDEYGGVDGLVTIEDLVEQIVGEINDEHDDLNEPELTSQADGSVLADARVSLEDFEERFGDWFSEEEREEVDTLGGLVFRLAGRVPTRGEMIGHPVGLEFEVLDADPRRIRRMVVHGTTRTSRGDVAAVPTKGH